MRLRLRLIHAVVLMMVGCVIALAQPPSGTYTNSILLPHLVVGKHAGLGYWTQIQISNPNLQPWVGELHVQMDTSDRMYAVKLPRSRPDYSFVGNLRPQDVVLDRNESVVYELHSNNPAAIGRAMLICGRQSKCDDISVSAFYRVEEDYEYKIDTAEVVAHGAKVVDVVTVPVVVAGNIYGSEAAHKVASIPVSIRTSSQFLRYKYLLEDAYSSPTGKCQGGVWIYWKDSSEIRPVLNRPYDYEVFRRVDDPNYHERLEGAFSSFTANEGGGFLHLEDLFTPNTYEYLDHVSGQIILEATSTDCYIRAIALIGERSEKDGLDRYTTILPTSMPYRDISR